MMNINNQDEQPNALNELIAKLALVSEELVRSVVWLFSALRWRTGMGKMKKMFCFLFVFFYQAESSDTQMQARLSAFLRQLQAIGDRLQVLVVRQHNHNSATCNVNNSGETIGNKDSCSVESLLQELQVLQGKMSERDQVRGNNLCNSEILTV